MNQWRQRSLQRTPRRDQFVNNLMAPCVGTDTRSGVMREAGMISASPSARDSPYQPSSQGLVGIEQVDALCDDRSARGKSVADVISVNGGTSRVSTVYRPGRMRPPPAGSQA